MNAIWSNPLYQKIILSLVVLVLQFGVRRLLLHTVAPIVPRASPHLYQLRKLVNYAFTFVVILVLAAIWLEHLGNLTLTLGLIGAGLTFALQEVIGSIAGWLTIITGQHFAIGDRIEVGGIRGDVVDIGVLRTTLMEIGNWLHADTSTGRLVTVSNAFIFKQPLFNYSRNLHFIWDEVQIPVTYDSDWKGALEIMKEAVERHPRYRELLPDAEGQYRRSRYNIALKQTPLEPRTFVQLTENWVELDLIYPVHTDIRRAFRSDVSRRILEAFETTKGITVAAPKLNVVGVSDERRKEDKSK
ncbi:MAG: mechanosensitive ion channel family protein [Anaerolineae bacterium]